VVLLPVMSAKHKLLYITPLVLRITCKSME